MTPCPACGGSSTEVFLTLAGLPVHSTAVCETREQALALPRADQVLTVCHTCALVFNSAFDPSLLDYSGHHEESQAFSPTFTAFARELAEGWVERYGLRGEPVVEVGCGKGQFLELLVDAGVGHAHGIDPGLDLARLPATDAVTGDVARFSPSELSRTARALVCRHTLEHIPDVGDFLRLLQDGIDVNRCRVLLLEVPDVGRVLDEAAFWDLQYEHCSSFTATSLSGLLQRHGMELLDLRLVYGGQYLVAECDPKPGRVAAVDLPVQPVPEVVERCRRFATDVGRNLEHWQEWFAARGAAGEVVVWGGGAKGSAFLSSVEGTGVRRVVDINPGLQGHFMGGTGLPIVAPEALADEPPAAVLLMNGIYLGEVRDVLDGLGLVDVELVAV